MSLIPSSLSSRGWAFLVLASGLVLSVPFFKAGNSESRYSSGSRSTPSATRPNTSKNGPLASPSTPIPSTTTMVDSPSTQVDHPLPCTSIEAAGIVELKPEPALTEADAANPNPSRPSNVTISQPARTDPQIGIAASPIRTELPAWAKKPSLIDSLLTTASSGTPALDVGEAQSLPARKPTPYQSWTTEQRSRALANAATEPTDRNSPFSDTADSNEDHKQSNSPISWPDEDPRTAVSQPQPLKPRLVGRDAIIRDPEVLKSLSESIGRTVVHPGMGKADIPSLDPSATVAQPKFGQASTPANRGPQIGPALRSKLPPDEQQFIRQPSL